LISCSINQKNAFCDQTHLAIDINNVLVDKLPAEEGSALIKSLQKANDFYSKAILRFETTTAGKFGRVDKNIFGPGAFKAGGINEDEVFSAVFNARSPRALADLKSLVGTNAFEQATRRFLETTFNASIKSVKNRAIRFDADGFAKKLGLDTDDGVKAFNAMLGGTKVKPKEFFEFLAVAKKAGEFAVPDTSVFLQRRFTLGGIRNILGGLAIGAVGLSNPISTAFHKSFL